MEQYRINSALKRFKGAGRLGNIHLTYNVRTVLSHLLSRCTSVGMANQIRDMEDH